MRPVLEILLMFGVATALGMAQRLVADPAVGPRVNGCEAGRAEALTCAVLCEARFRAVNPIVDVLEARLAKKAIVRLVELDEAHSIGKELGQ